MKRILILLLLLIGVSSFSTEWSTNLEESLIKAKAENKLVVMVFQGSDWCAPCRKLDKKVWQTDTFADYAKQYFVMCKVDFPRKSKNKLSAQQQKLNKELADQYNPQAYFPLVVILDNSGKIIGKTGYKSMTAKAYISHLESIIKQ